MLSDTHIEYDNAHLKILSFPHLSAEIINNIWQENIEKKTVSAITISACDYFRHDALATLCHYMARARTRTLVLEKSTFLPESPEAETPIKSLLAPLICALFPRDASQPPLPLQNLYITDCLLRDSDIIPLIEAIKTAPHKFLQKVTLDRNLISEETEKHILSYYSSLPAWERGVEITLTRSHKKRCISDKTPHSYQDHPMAENAKNKHMGRIGMYTFLHAILPNNSKEPANRDFLSHHLFERGLISDMQKFL